MILLIILLAIVLIAIVLFATWFFSAIADGKCPICALKNIGSSKLTIDTSLVDDFSNGAPSAPLMGWSSWNTLRNHLCEDDIVEMADAMVELGLLDAGYKYVNLDDCWHSSLRDADGKLQGDLETFPSGIEALCKKVNERGLKLGIYSSNGTLTCEDLPASLGNEELDAKTFASWGIEYLKYDFCHHEKIKGNTPVIEYLDINTRGERSQIRLNPEDAIFTGKAKIVKCSDLPTKKGIGFLNHNAGTASFNVDVTGGEYILTIHYRKKVINPKQYLQVSVNGTIYEVFFPSGRSFTPDARIQLIIRLQNGTNTIKLQNPVVTKADSSYIQYRRMGNALRDAASAWATFTNSEIKPITYSICEWGRAKPWTWGAKAGNMWRTTMDIMPNWLSIVNIYNKTIKLYKYASPSHVNDPDMLEVGNGKLTVDENKSHFTLWCMMAAPLVLGNDIRKLLDYSEESQRIRNILTNKSLILIDQDPAVKAGKLIGKQGSIDIIARPLYNGDVALCFFNKSKSKKAINFNLNDLKNEAYLEFSPVTIDYQIHDLWSDERTTSASISTNVPSHGVKVYRISE